MICLFLADVKHLIQESYDAIYDADHVKVSTFSHEELLKVEATFSIQSTRWQLISCFVHVANEQEY